MADPRIDYDVLPEAIGRNPFGEAVRPDIQYLRNDVNIGMSRDYSLLMDSIRNNVPQDVVDGLTYEFYRKYGMNPMDYGDMIKQKQSQPKSIPASYKTNSMKDITTAIQQSIYDGTNIGKNYGEGFVDGKYGNSTASAMIDTLNQFFDANLSNDGTTYDKTRRIQTWLKSNGFKGADGNDLVLDGKFGKNTAEAFSRAYLKFKEQMIKGAEFARQAEEREAAQLAAQQAAEAQAAAQQEAYRNSPAVRAERPNYNMFSGVNLPYEMPETRENDYGPVDIFGRRI